MNALTRLAVAVAFCLAALPTRADVTAKWSSIAADAVRAARENPASADRSLAAVRDAMAAARGSGNGNGNGHVSAADSERRDAAQSVAAFAVLEALYPEQRENFEMELAIAFSRIPETAAKAEGAALGRRIAAETIRNGREIRP